MGRVAKYKKVKAFDKQHQGGEYIWGNAGGNKTKKRSLTAERHKRRKMKKRGYDVNQSGFDLPPDGDDFDLSDLVVKKQPKQTLDAGLMNGTGTALSSVQQSSTKASASPATPADSSSSSSRPAAIVKNQTIQIGNTSVALSIPLTEKEESRTHKLLHIDSKTGQSKSLQTSNKIGIEGRREGESMNAFNRRLKEETEMALAKNYKKRKESDETVKIGPDGEEKMSRAQKRKEYSKMRKKRRKNKNVTLTTNGSGNDDGYGNDDDNDGFITGEQAASRISFLEQAEQPPIFQQLPRGAHKKLKMKMRGSGNSDGNSSGKKKNVNSNNMDEEKIKAEQNAMEIMRRKVQAQYAIMKAKRRQAAGSFHL